MLGKKLGQNDFTLTAIVSAIESDHLLVSVNNIHLKVNGCELDDVMVGSNVLIKCTYDYKDKQPVLDANSFELYEGNEDLVGKIEGVVTQVDYKGDESNPWASVLLTTKYKSKSSGDNVTSSIVKFNMSKSSLDTINFDIREGDVLGVMLHKTNVEENLVLKVNKVFNHIPKQVLDYYNSAAYRKDRGLAL
ncbi:hypothetical protein SAMN04488136_116109 [Vibrio xiamenensis]|uniref:Uncharacterized protein n=2 Tax=Vibrio xiamenensis TaxID=861298 RepID=A0A1G8CJV3_9VIBR|nr:hypothetical protein SAMN04488136_116109 [Vibrio xiamenensis]